MKRLAVALTPSLLFAHALLAQTESASPVDTSTPSAAGVAAGLAGCGIVGVIWLLVVIVPWLWAAIWVTKDANRRNSPNATLVKVLTWIPFTWFIGWIIHLATRPKTTA